MNVQVNADANIDFQHDLASSVEEMVRHTLERFGPRVIRLEVHLSDENGTAKGGADDKKCLVEARLASHQPVAVSHHAPTIQQAVAGASTKMKHALDKMFGKLATH